MLPLAAASACAGPGTPSAPAPSSPRPSGSPSGIAVPSPTADGGPVLACGDLDARKLLSQQKQGEMFDLANACISRALMTGMRAEVTYEQPVGGSGVVLVTYRVLGPGRLEIVEDHRADTYAPFAVKIRTCTAARSLEDQGACTSRVEGRR